MSKRLTAEELKISMYRGVNIDGQWRKKCDIPDGVYDVTKSVGTDMNGIEYFDAIAVKVRDYNSEEIHQMHMSKLLMMKKELETLIDWRNQQLSDISNEIDDYMRSLADIKKLIDSIK